MTTVFLESSLYFNRNSRLARHSDIENRKSKQHSKNGMQTNVLAAERRA